MVANWQGFVKWAGQEVFCAMRVSCVQWLLLSEGGRL